MKQLESVSYDYYLLRKQYDSSISSPQIEKIDAQIKTDGNRVDHRSRIWANYSDRNNTNIDSTDPRERSFLWDGDSLYMYRWMSEGANANSQAFIERNDNEKQAYLAIDDGSSPLRGIMGGDFDRIDAILAKSDSFQVLNEKEIIGDTECYVLLAKGKHGKYKIWLDPDHGYNIAKARVLKKQDDIAWRNLPLSPRITEDKGLRNTRQYIGSQHPGMKESFSFTLENVKFKNINGIWCPVAGEFQAIIKHVNGRTVTVKSTIECENIAINPEYDEDDFKPDNIVDGTLVGIVPHQIAYTWINGKPVPNIDEAAIDQLDKITDEILAEGKKCQASPESVAEITLDKILAEYRKTQKRLGLFYCEGAVSENDKQTTSDLYTCDGASFGVQVRANQEVTDCFIWDGKKTMHYTSESVLASVNKNKPYQLLATVYPGSPLLGYMNGQPERIDTVLSKVSKKATVSQEKLSGTECYVVTAPVGQESWRVWFSPEQGYHIVKAEVQKDSKPVYLLDQVQFKTIEDVSVPVLCAVKDSSRQYTYERTKIELKPDFTAIKAFESEISDGTGVTVEGMEGKYYWNSGQVVDEEGKNVF
jgi:hypothetical protein